MLKLFSGSANIPLAQEVSSLVKIPLATSEIIRFGNSEVKVTIQEDVKHNECVIIQPTANPTDTNMMELFFFCDSLRRQEARRVIGIIPYFGYARQDIQHREGECVSANVVIRFFESIGFYKIYTIDLHDEATEGVFSIPFKNMSSLPILAERIKEYIGNNSIDAVQIVSPDQGGIERARKFGSYFFGQPDFPLTVIEKRRDLNKIHTTKALDLYGDVKEKIVILVDDIVTSGTTLINASNLCMEKGAKKVIASIVHHDFSTSAPQKLQNSVIDAFFTTNTIALKEGQKFNKMKEISVAKLIQEELSRLQKLYT
ncbi:MAG: ribose-phosphate pyrophosphokinase [bacterium]|nr:ribose-phosphate pyrophosphokinase [bacterium]